MSFDIGSAIPVKEKEFIRQSAGLDKPIFAGEEVDLSSISVHSITEPSIGFDIASAKPVSKIEDITFKTLDASNIFMNTAKDLFRGIERIPAGIGSGIEFLGRDIVAEEKSKTYPIIPFVRSWRRSKGKKVNKIGEVVEDFSIRFGNTLAEIGKTTKDFYNEAASKGIESPNPAVMMGWKHPFRKVLSLAAENFPMLGLATATTAITESPTAGATIFFPAIAGDMYEEAIKNGVNPHTATDMAIADGVVQTALESIVLGNWMKGGSITKRVFRTALQEGLIEEGTQQIFENSLKIAGWKEPRPVWERLTDGLAESILAGMVSGGALGTFQAPSIEDIRYDLHNEITKDGINQGLEPEQISQVLDKVDEVIDKTLGIEPAPEIKEAEKAPVTADLKGEMAGKEGLIKAYHGTNKQFDAFESTEGVRSNWLGGTVKTKSPVFFFSKDKKIAKSFAKDRVLESGGKARVMEVDLTMNKTLDMTGDLKELEKTLNDIGINLRKIYGTEPLMGTLNINRDQMWELFDKPEIVEALKKAGYDSAIIDEVGEDGADFQTYVIFDAKQIKTSSKLSPTEGGKVVNDLKESLDSMTDENKFKVLSDYVYSKYKEYIDTGEYPYIKQIQDYIEKDNPNLTEEQRTSLHTQIYNASQQFRKEKRSQTIEELKQLGWTELTSDEPLKQAIKDGNYLKIYYTKSGLLSSGKNEEVFKPLITEDGKAYLMKPRATTKGIHLNNFILETNEIAMYKIVDKKGNEISVKAEGLAMAEPGGETIGSAEGKLGVRKKVVPEVAEKIAWEKTEPWKVNAGRDIAGIFEKHIGPELQVSKRLKKWLGVYYPMLGTNGLIRVRSLSDETTLNHETGHFLDDALGNVEISRKKEIRDELKKVDQFISPWDITAASKSYKSYRNSKAELFANYVAAYTLNTDKVKELAPKFTTEVENTIGKDREWNYVIAKLREFQETMRPLKEYVNALRKIPEFQKDLKEWVEKGNILQQLWRNKVGDKVWDLYRKGIENLGKKLHATMFFERGGLNEAVSEILRQRRKLIQGQQQKLREELIDPISELTKEEQQFVSESLQRFEQLTQDTELNQLTEQARSELALWGNEARKLGLLNDEVFWNNIGQYFPFFYETKEFEKNKRSFGYFPSKAIKARFESLKHKMTDEEFGRKVLEAQYGTFPSGKKKIAEYGKEELEKIGQNAREELGLIKTAAYPLQRRLFGMIEMIYTVRAFNIVATLPGIVGHKGVEGFDKMPEGKKYGVLAGQYVPIDLVKEVSKWNNLLSEFDKIWQGINVVWKMFKVPYNPAAVSRNIITNAIMTWMGDVPIYNPVVAGKGIKSFIVKDEAYKLLRDRGLYHNTYSEQELKELAFVIDEDSNNPWQGIQKWANGLLEVAQSPARLYGTIEDISKTIIARYSLDSGASPEQAVKFADKLLFDYSQVSEITDKARKGFMPFFTWSAKILPRMVEFVIRKPEKFLLLGVLTMIVNGLSRMQLGIDKDDEERLKPDYIRGKMVLLLPERDINGDLNWIDLTYFLPWGGWLPVEKGRLAIPQTLTMGSPLLAFYNAFVLNHDPFYGEIAPDYLPDDEKVIEQGKYILKSLGPNILTMTPNKIIKSIKTDKYKRKGEPAKVFFGELTGIKLTRDISPYRKAILSKAKNDYYKGAYKIKEKVKMKEITREEGNKKLEKLKERFKQEKESH